MGFRDARSRLIESLKTGAYEHEAREVQAERNWLAVGDREPEFVVDLLRRARGDGYECSLHHADPTTTVHVFRCHHGTTRWYVKAYFLDAMAVFISVHPSE